MNLNFFFVSLKFICKIVSLGIFFLIKLSSVIRQQSEIFQQFQIEFVHTRCITNLFLCVWKNENVDQTIEKFRWSRKLNDVYAVRSCKCMFNECIIIALKPVIQTYKLSEFKAYFAVESVC